MCQTLERDISEEPARAHAPAEFLADLLVGFLREHCELRYLPEKWQLPYLLSTDILHSLLSVMV
jgi:hypothetical protein